MTDILTDPAFSRRDLLKGGVLIVGFSLAGASLPETASAALGDSAGPPDPKAVDFVDCDPCRQHRNHHVRQMRARPG